MASKVSKLTQAPTCDANWNKSPWLNIPAETLSHYMGDKPEHFPSTEVKCAYDDSAMYVIFQVKDKYIRAAAKEHQDCVCVDSCVEFFFAPSTDVALGYFNLEMNCGGTMLLHFQTIPRENQLVFSESDLKKINYAHSMPRIVDPELEGPATWTVEYSIPISLLEKYCAVDTPKSGTVWRANFFKCADHTSHPHWLTWSPIDAPKPDFHRPHSFGELVFE